MKDVQIHDWRAIRRKFYNGYVNGHLTSALIVMAIGLSVNAMGGDIRLILIFFPLLPIVNGVLYARKEWKSQLSTFRSHHHICVHCGYDLRATTSNMCPECGRYFRLKPPHLTKIIGAPEQESSDGNQAKDKTQ
jgi:hypothetical protein